MEIYKGEKKMVRKTKEGEEKKFLEELKTELCAIRGQAGEVITRVNKIERKITDYERKRRGEIIPGMFDEGG